MRRFSLAVALAFMVLIATGCSARRANLAEAYIRGADRVLEVIVNSCNADHTITVDESGSQVVITVTVRNDNTNLDCQDAVMVTLLEPLGERSVVDGTTGQSIEVIRLPGSG